MMIKIYHNPRCTKSRETLQLLNDKGAETEIVEYLKDVPDREELQNLIALLGVQAQELVRTSEPIYLEKFKGRKLSESKWIDAMVKYPKLIQRPIVVKGKKAIIGRPPEKVLELI